MICPRCAASGRVLFWLPRSWDGGICMDCALEDPEWGPAFRAHFGAEVRHVSDGDTGSGQAKPRT